MTGENWLAKDDDVARIAGADHGDPFSVLGLHILKDGAAIRAFAPVAASRY